MFHMDLLENQMFILTCLILSVFRLYLELIKFDFQSLPITKLMAQRWGVQKANQVHRFGLYLSVGQIILFAPAFLF